MSMATLSAASESARTRKLGIDRFHIFIAGALVLLVAESAARHAAAGGGKVKFKIINSKLKMSGSVRGRGVKLIALLILKWSLFNFQSAGGGFAARSF